jgi:hypothetical protein
LYCIWCRHFILADGGARQIFIQTKRGKFHAAQLVNVQNTQTVPFNCLQVGALSLACPAIHRSLRCS